MYQMTVPKDVLQSLGTELLYPKVMLRSLERCGTGKATAKRIDQWHAGTSRLWISLWRTDFCTRVGAPPKITRRMWKWSAKWCKGKLIDARRRKPRMSTENSKPKKFSLWRKKGGINEGLLNWNGHLARLQWCMASSMIHGKTLFQHAWFKLLKARQENWNRRKR